MVTKKFWGHFKLYGTHLQNWFYLVMMWEGTWGGANSMQIMLVMIWASNHFRKKWGCIYRTIQNKNVAFFCFYILYFNFFVFVFYQKIKNFDPQKHMKEIIHHILKFARLRNSRVFLWNTLKYVKIYLFTKIVDSNMFISFTWWIKIHLNT